jgi:hypothetical protein
VPGKRRVRLGHVLLTPAPRALDPQEPRRERPQGRRQCLVTRGIASSLALAALRRRSGPAKDRATIRPRERATRFPAQLIDFFKRYKATPPEE